MTEQIEMEKFEKWFPYTDENKPFCKEAWFACASSKEEEIERLTIEVNDLEKKIRNNLNYQIIKEAK